MVHDDILYRDQHGDGKLYMGDIYLLGGIKLDVFPLILDFIGTMWISEDQNGKLRSKCHLELTN
jgi:hypothetical protein